MPVRLPALTGKSTTVTWRGWAAAASRMAFSVSPESVEPSFTAITWSRVEGVAGAEQSADGIPDAAALHSARP